MNALAPALGRLHWLLAMAGIPLAGAAGAALVMGAQVSRVSILAAPLGLIALWWLVRRPQYCLALLFGLPLILESDPQGFLPVARFYSRIGKLASPTDLLLVLAVVAVALDLSRRRERLKAPGAFTYPLILMAVGLVWGGIVGIGNGASKVYALNDADALLYVIIAPVLVVNAVRARTDLMRVMAGLTALAGAKSVLGLVGWALGKGRPIIGTHLTYYDPTPNILLSVVVLAAAAAMFARVPLPPRGRVVSCLALVTLLLSFRRSFWIADAVAMSVIAVVAVGRVRRWLVVLGGAAAVLAVAAVFVVGGATSATSTTSPLGQRVASLSPTALQQSSSDRYRIDEDRNVASELVHHPITGIGLGVPWTVRYPMAPGNIVGAYYNHVVVLFLWLKLGLFGLIGYLWLWAAILWTGWRVWRSERPDIVRVASLGLCGALAGLAIIELTASFTGADPRASIEIGGAIGLLAVAAAQLQETTTGWESAWALAPPLLEINPT